MATVSIERRDPRTVKTCLWCRRVKPKEHFVTETKLTRWGNVSSFLSATCIDCRGSGHFRAPVLEKRCGSCGEVKEASEFYTFKYETKTGKPGVRFESSCKSCKLQKQRIAGEARRQSRRKTEQERHRRNREAISAAAKLRYQSKREAILTRTAQNSLRYNHGLSPEQYRKMFEAQEGLCAICRLPAEAVKNRKHLNVDHCHETGKIRGLLCHNCNVSLGLLRDDIGTARRLVAYLEQHESPRDNVLVE